MPVASALALLLLIAIGTGTAAAAPTATMQPATNVAYTTAQLNAEVEPGGEQVSFTFQYIPDQRYEENIANGVSGFAGARADYGSTETAGPIPREETGLSPATLYHARVIVQGGSGPVESNAITFTTKTVTPPSVSLDPVSAITGNTAHFSATINPEAPAGDPPVFEVHWEFICTPACDVVGSGTLPSDATAHQVEAEAFGLIAGTSYQVELVARNAAGPISSTETFSTPAVAPAVTTLPAFALEGGTSAIVGASIDPQNSPTTYWLEYGPTTAYGQSVPVTRDGSIAAGTERVTVDQAIAGLTPSTTYHVRVVAENANGPSTGADLTFETPPASAAVAQNCPNAAARAQQSMQQLPDCRGYELVTPVDTNGAPPYTVGGISGFVANIEGDLFSSPPAAPSGNSYKFTLLSTAVPGLEGNGSANQYRVQRGPTGWTTSLSGPTGTQSGINGPGGFSGDGGLTTFVVQHNEGRFTGSLDTGAEAGSHYLYGPEGSIQLVGEGTLPASPDTDGNDNGFADEPNATVHWISEGGRHVIFDTYNYFSFEEAIKLTPDAPEDGIAAVYDRTPTGLDVISLLPGNVTPTENSSFQGSSADGSTVLFKTGNTLYARIDDRETLPVVSGVVSPSGVSADGERVFYAKGGDLFAFNTSTDATTRLNDSEDARFVEVSSDGSRAYFLSPSLLDGAQGTRGADNLYEWSAAGIAFIATVEPEDVKRFPNGNLSGESVGLGKWSEGGESQISPAKNEAAAKQTSRSTPSGTAFVFESRARLTGYESAGHSEVYLHRPGQPLICVSCNPSGEAAAGDASLLPEDAGFVGTNALVPNLSESGDEVFFETTDSLVPADTNGVGDVYEWENGHVYLLSAGTGSRPSYVTGATPDGSSVFISTTDQLVSNGQEPGLRAVYAVRVGGGFLTAERTVGGCAGESCQGEVTLPPAATGPASTEFVGPRNPATAKKKAKHHKKKHQKKKHHRKKHKQANDSRQHRGASDHAKKNAGGSK